MLTYPGQNTPQHEMKGKVEEAWPTIQGWVEGFFWGTVRFFKDLLSALFNVFLNR